MINNSNDSATNILDQDNYSLLLCTLLILVKENQNMLQFKLSSDNSKLTIIIDRSMEFTDFQLFVKLFDELTLNRLHFINSGNSWICEIFL